MNPVNWSILDQIELFFPYQNKGLENAFEANFRLIWDFLLSFNSFSDKVCAMEKLLSQSRNILLFLLSVSLLLTFYQFKVDDTTFTVPVPESSKLSIVKPAESVWSSIRAELRLDHKAESAQVRTEIHKMLADKEKLIKILESSAPYIYFIHKETQKHNLPAEIALIPVIESEFNPNDHSSAGATGLWQLMPGTATGLGVKVKPGYDGRRNVVASTKAALTYLDSLKKYFKGNWYLAISAYNCGEGKIASAVRRKGTSNVWQLKLPTETKEYLPKLLAIAEIIKNPDRYGVKLPHIVDRPYFAAVEVKKPVSLTNVAKTTGTNLKTLTALNPDYRHGIVMPNKQGHYILLVPVMTAPAVKATLPVATITTKP